MKLKFTKMQGCGNDYIYIDCFEQNVSEPEKLAVKLSDRHFSVGGDGVILICPSDKADCKMRMFNLDGSEGNMCGNGIRCVAKYMYERRGLRKENITVETKSGIKQLKTDADKDKVLLVTVDMGKPKFDCESVPVIADKKEMLDEKITVNNIDYKVTCVSMGNPHCVIFCDDIENIDVCGIGDSIAESGIFPNGVNFEFVTVTDGYNMKMRVCERGSGETLACGTGACAAVSAAVKLGCVPQNRKIKVELLGGELYVTSTDSTVTMAGGAEIAFDGEVEI